MAERRGQLTFEERKLFEKLYNSKVSLTEISNFLGINWRTAYKELSRGFTGHVDRSGRKEYSAMTAQLHFAESMSHRGRKPGTNTQNHEEDEE